MRLAWLACWLVACSQAPPPSPAEVATLEVSYAGGELGAATYDAATHTYRFAAGVWLARVQLAVAPSIDGASITIDGAPATPGVPSTPIELPLGTTKIAIVIDPPVGDPVTLPVEITRAPEVMQHAKVLASNAEAGDGFGNAIAIYGDTMVVGAPSENSAATGINGDQNDNSAFQSGAAYVFRRDGDHWLQEAYLKPSNTRTFDTFGFAVAIWGNTIAVGSEQEPSAATGIDGDQNDISAEGAGAVYVFHRVNGTWSQEAYLKASNTDISDLFGASVSLWEDTLVVGAMNEDSGGAQADNSVKNAGAAYVFARDNGTWIQQGYLKASNPLTGVFFGLAVAVSGDTVAVGAFQEGGGSGGINGNQADQSQFGSGAVYVYRRTGSTWAQEAYVKAAAPAMGDSLGRSVALWGDTLAVGAPYNGPSGTVFVYERDAMGWHQRVALKPFNPEANDYFGEGVALFGDRLAVGAYGEDGSATGVNPADGTVNDNAIYDAGAVYMFSRSDRVWSPDAYVKALDPGVNDYVGQKVGVWGDTLVFGTYAHDHNTGAAYVFE